MLKRYDFHTIFAVPYALKLIADTAGGTEALTRLQLVLAAGSACPDELGQTLSDAGVHIVCHYGSTEMGHMMTSARAEDDKDWNYLRVAPRGQPFLRFEEVESGLYELVVLDGWPAKVMANRDDGSYGTNDLFAKHPTKENRWKYIGRRDDTLTLITGEKINPLAMEGRIRQSKLVSDVVVFGERRTHLGMFIIPSEVARELPFDDLMRGIHENLTAMNREAPDYARIDADMITLLPIDVEVKRTLKSTIVRAAFYYQFKDQIEDMYAAFDNGKNGAEKLRLGRRETMDFLTGEIAALGCDVSKLDESTDLFNIGLNSLQAIQIRGKIARNLDTGDRKVPQNVVFEYPSIGKLADFITGASVNGHIVTDVMQAMIEKYSELQPQKVVGANPRDAVLLTGVTGSLGSHILNSLLEMSNYTIYCLVRADSVSAAKDRVKVSSNRVIALPCDLSDRHLGLEVATYELLRGRLRHIIHCAWSVNFNWSLESFEKDNIKGLHHLLQLGVASTNVQFSFISSVGAVMQSPTDFVPETFDADLTHSQNSGYGQSKLVGEHMCEAVAKKYGFNAQIIRVGQLVGDSVHGAWNMTEAFPLMIGSVGRLHALPALPLVCV